VPANDRLAFRDALARRPILLDAAMGTRLVARGLDLASDDPCRWVIHHPLEVYQIHQRDVAAGAEALLTNTFGANRVWLDRWGEGDETRSINHQAVYAARRAAGPGRYVIGSIGPTASDHPAALREQAEALVERGADALLLETHRLGQAEAALDLLRDLPLPILASLFDWPDPIVELAHRLIDRGAIAIGANCTPGMAPALALARKLRAAVDHPLLIKPSAGLPGSSLDSPEAFAEAVPELLALGVRLIGGCCGTTEAHVAAMREAIDRAIP
jgi:5-methyltetrahydrofolate--homocysteine methyltransferase